MKILIADDDPLNRRVVYAALAPDGHEIVQADDGEAAWQALQAPEAPSLAVLDWLMPHKTGLELCRLARAGLSAAPYLILLTSKREHADIVTALNAGADDYIVKPFDAAELRARVGVGIRIVTLQQALAARVGELELALANIKQLRGLLPVCAWCRRVRNDADYWQQIEVYITEHSDAQISHGICPDCVVNVERGGL
jgi:DNA-binding response OmpR family regulator